MNESDYYNPNHFGEIIDSLKKMEMLFQQIENKDNVRRISKHDVLVRGELKDLDIIWKRFLCNRQELIELSTKRDQYLQEKGNPKSKEAQEIFKREDEVVNSLKVDLKSLFLFGDILFNKLVLLIRAIYGANRGIKYESFSSFLKSIRNLEKITSPEHMLYSKLGEDLEKIDVLLGFYRDKFIVHVSGPYQEGMNWSVYLPDIGIDHTSWKLDKFNFDEFNELVELLNDILPSRDKYGNPLEKPCDPRLKVEVLFMNLHKIKDPDLKQRAEGYIRSVGLRSPDIYYLLKTVKDTSIQVIESLEEYVNEQYIAN
jgi:hypothetical protein